MNLKKAKAIRRVLNEALSEYGLTHRYAEYADMVVPSGRQHLTLKNTQTGEIIPGALQRRLTRGCPRDMYQRMKANVRQGSGT